MFEIKISPDLRIVANKLSHLPTELLSPIVEESAEESAAVIEAAIKAEVPVRTGDS